jgi:lactate racemase
MRIPILQGTRVGVARVPDDTVLIAAPPRLDPIADVAEAAAQALRHPLSGPSLEAIVKPGARVTIVIEPPSLPVPGAPDDPRQHALAGVIDELARLGAPLRNHTLLVAAGLQRRPGRRDVERLLRPGRARDFNGTVAVHDAEADDLVVVGDGPAGRLRVARSLVEADVVIVVSAAETVSHGGAATLARAADAHTARLLAGGGSLLAVGGPAWETALAVEAALGCHVPVIGLSLVLDHVRPTGRWRGWPSEAAASGLARSRLRAAHGILPSPVRVGVFQGLDREIHAVSVLAGAPSAAHAEALIRGISLRGTRLGSQLEALVVPVPWKSIHRPRSALNPVTVMATAAHALGLWRGAPAIVEGGTLIVPHPLSAATGHGVEAPYLRLLHALRAGAEGRKLAAVERLARTDARALERYRSGASVHPLLPFADWDAVQAVVGRTGRVLVAGCRDAAAARALGLVPTHSLQAALTMVAGVAESTLPTGLLLAPPYAPLLVDLPGNARDALPNKGTRGRPL